VPRTRRSSSDQDVADVVVAGSETEVLLVGMCSTEFCWRRLVFPRSIVTDVFEKTDARCGAVGLKHYKFLAMPHPSPTSPTRSWTDAHARSCRKW